jgi:hypothetical protein
MLGGDKKMKWQTLVLALCAAVFAIDSGHAGCNESAAQSVTGTMNAQLASLVGFTMVACSPAQEAGKCSIVCITTSSESDANVNILLVAITASAAVNMRKVGVSRFSRVSFADKNLLQRRRYLSITASGADHFQKILVDSSYSPPQAMSMVRREYQEEAIPERK